MYLNSVLRILKYGLKRDEEILPSKQVFLAQTADIVLCDSKDCDTHYLVLHENTPLPDDVSKICKMSDRVAGKINDVKVEFGLGSIKSGVGKVYLPFLFTELQTLKIGRFKNLQIEIDII